MVETENKAVSRTKPGLWFLGKSFINVVIRKKKRKEKDDSKTFIILIMNIKQEVQN